MNWLFVIAGVVMFACMINGYKKGTIKMCLSFGVILLSFLATLLLLPSIREVIIAVTPIDEKIEERYEAIFDIGKPNIENSRINQIQMLEEADLPSFFKKGLIVNNNYEMYHMLEVNTFKEYVITYLSYMTIQMALLLILWFLLYIIVHAAFYSIPFIEKIQKPDNKLHRIIGMAGGALLGVLWIWILLYIVVLIYPTSVGRMCDLYIESNRVLMFFYSRNSIVKYAVYAFI